ncbi:hypothetical protein ACEWY4_008468 [Coilia grayii]|uniref:Uncharacterized protein n=1 Tax=Coilia grayii TaxID=363190 RepID=A0ABD1KB24_9TELE
MNVHPDHCTLRFHSTRDRFLSNDTQQQVQRAWAEGFYRGQELMATKSVEMKVRELSIRAEYTLLYLPKPSQFPLQVLLDRNGPESCVVFYVLVTPCPNPAGPAGQNRPRELRGVLCARDPLPKPSRSLLQVLLDRTGPESCVVFYVLVTPCVTPCTNVNGPYSLIASLDLLAKHRGPKAFVFKRLWGADKDVSGSLREISKRVPLYRCSPQCVACGGDHGSPIAKDCVQ